MLGCPCGAPGGIFAAGVWLGVLSSSAAPATRAMSRPLGTAGEVTQNEGCRQHQRPQSRASEGILQTKGKALPQALSFQERSATLQKNKALAKKMVQGGGNCALPSGLGPPAVARGFPWMSSHLGFSQQPHPSLLRRCWWGHLAPASTLQTPPYPTKHQQVATGQGFQVCHQGLDTPDWSYWQ